MNIAFENIDFVAVFLFIISLFFTVYFYFKQFYRLVFSENSIIHKDHRSEGEKIYKSRIIFYNNGRKALRKDKVHGLALLTSKILNTEILFKQEDSKVSISADDNRVNIEIDNLDTSGYFVLSLLHVGKLKVKGRIDETGKILRNETKTWAIIATIVSVLSVLYVAFSFYEVLSTYTSDSNSQYFFISEPFVAIFIRLVLIMGVILVLNWLHGLFFIPVQVESKFFSKDNKGTYFKI